MITSDPRRGERVRLIARAGWHLTGMIGDVLDLSRIESGNVNVSLGPVDLPALLQEAMALMAGQAESEGVSLAVHTTLLEGLAALRSAPPDLLLLDMQLPDGSGLELLRALADDPLLATVPVVMVSADVMEDSIGAALQAGARAYIAKPFNFDEVLKQLDAVLAQTT